LYLLQHLLTNATAKVPERTAVRFGTACLSYAELDRLSGSLAATLTATGVGRGDRVGIMLEKSLASIISIFGVLKAGGVYVPLESKAPPGRLIRIIERCGIRCLICSGRTLGNLHRGEQEPPKFQSLVFADATVPAMERLGGDPTCLGWDEAISASSDQPNPVLVTDGSPAYILHTSGSTGVPKGVVLSHLNALTFVRMATKFFGFNEADRVANQASLGFDLSVLDVFCAVSAGAAIVLVPESLASFPAKLAEFIDKERISVWNSVASLLNMLAERGRLDRFSYDSLRLIHFSGDVLPPKYLRVLRSHMRRAEFYNIYGQTEANSSLCFPVGDLPSDDAWWIPIGKPFPNFEVFALDEQARVIHRPGEEGELYVASSTVALGYWLDEEDTQKRFVPDPRGAAFGSRVYRTGDLARLDRDGNFVFVGRADSMVKVRGHRVELNETELALASHPAVSEAVALALPDSLVGARIVACVTLVISDAAAAEDLKAHCAKIVPFYMVPEEIRIVKELPRTTTGKADRQLLRTVHFGGGGSR
jgi:amino acid adenylation domain-containing protein